MMTRTDENPTEASATFSLMHCVDVSAPPEEAYRLINAVEEWPDFFPPCQAARIIESHGDTVLIEITARVGSGVRTWRSKRKKIPERYLVEFEQMDPFPPVHSMGGNWQVHPLATDRCRVELFHSFEITSKSASEASVPRTVSEAEDWVRTICDANSESELQAFKTRCEQDNLRQPKAAEAQPGAARCTFADHVTMRTSIDGIYAKLWDVERWPEMLPHVVSVQMLEDRAGYQRFKMETRGEHGVHQTESVRQSTGKDCVVYEQLILPPLLRSHGGRWLLEPVDDGVLVTAEHTIELNPGAIPAALGRDYSLAEAQLLTRHFIGNHSVKTLNAIRRLLETGDAGEQP